MVERFSMGEDMPSRQRCQVGQCDYWACQDFWLLLRDLDLSLILMLMALILAKWYVSIIIMVLNNGLSALEIGRMDPIETCKGAAPDGMFHETMNVVVLSHTDEPFETETLYFY